MLVVAVHHYSRVTDYCILYPAPVPSDGTVSVPAPAAAAVLIMITQSELGLMLSGLQYPYYDLHTT